MTRDIHFQYHRPGKETVVYEETLALDRPDVKVLLQSQYSGADVVAGSTVILEHGAPIVWYIFAEAWHDVGRFHMSDGSLTGWYTNLSKPVEFRGDSWVGHDLFLDLWQPAAGDAVWLDEDEFEDAAKSGLLDAATRKRVQNERVLIDLQLKEGSWPPPICQDLDLTQVRSLLEG